MRCWKCPNCQKILKLRKQLLGMSKPLGKGLSDDELQVWNQSLQDFPCQEEAK